MNNIICLISTNGVGCTFLDWSIHYLANQTDFYNCKSQSLIPLSQDPVTQLNAHGHKKNHPIGLDETVDMYHHLCTQPSNRFYSMYHAPLFLDQVIKKHGYTLEQYQQPAIQQHVAQHQTDEFYSTINWLLDNKSQVIMLDQDPNLRPYAVFTRQLERMKFQNQRPQSEQDLMDETNSVYFQSSVDTWNKLQLTNVWDQRERDALNIRPFKISPIVCNFDRPVCRINSLEFWGFAAEVLTKVMNFLQLEIDAQRLDQWHPVYRKWQNIQFKMLDFVINLDYIIEATIKNYNYPLRNLTYQQEVILQHCLIYKHGLNLKTWQLEKFPNNTQELHKLLETNIHPVEKIYD